MWSQWVGKALWRKIELLFIPLVEYIRFRPSFLSFRSRSLYSTAFSSLSTLAFSISAPLSLFLYTRFSDLCATLFRISAPRVSKFKSSLLQELPRPGPLHPHNLLQIYLNLTTTLPLPQPTSPKYHMRMDFQPSLPINLREHIPTPPNPPPPHQPPRPHSPALPTHPLPSPHSAHHTP